MKNRKVLFILAFALICVVGVVTLAACSGGGASSALSSLPDGVLPI